jgi:hypothetical protein
MNRIYHTWDKWECYPAGFYENSKEGMKKEECELAYKELLSNDNRFENALKRVIIEWKNSCEHYLTNESMNRIAWLGQAALCIELGIPSCFRSGYFLLSENEQKKADLLALKYLNIWLKKYNEHEVDLDGAGVKAKAQLY